MSELYIVTGANGHVGNTMVRRLLRDGKKVRGLILPEDASHTLDGLPVELVRADLRDREALRPLLAHSPDETVYVIHTAGIVTIASKFRQEVYDVNVGGTENLLGLCHEYGVKRLLYVSSVHAIPEKPAGESMTEIDHFEQENAVGLYARTKAAATQLVLDNNRDGLETVVVHPSGIVGPGDYGHGHLTQMVMDYMDHRLTACVKGGYDFVDVRDVCEGILAALEHGRPGECYILSGSYCDIPQFLEILHEVSHRRPVKTVLPLWFAKLTAPLAELYYKLRHQPPLFTRYSLYTLRANAGFSHQKATRELGYKPRPLRDTLADTVSWLVAHKRVKATA